MVLGSSVVAGVTQCEDDDEDEDPYENLPDEDEPTGCGICLTYRQGPCRPYWRKVERCTKDHELKKEEDDLEAAREGKEVGDKDNEEGSSQQDEPPCLKYMLPWIDCATGYRNLYAFIEMDTNYTEGIADLEKDATMEACWASSSEPAIDWTPWQKYVKEHPEWKLPKRSATQPKDGSPKESLWKTLGTDEDPEVVEILAAVPATQGEKGIIECAYAVDQDGHVLGFSYGTKPSEAAQKSASANGDANANTDAKDDNDSNMIELTIRLLPARTRQIILAAAYTHPGKDTEKEESEPESHILKSRPFSLKKMGKQQS